MNREIVTDPLEPEDLWADLRTNLKLLNELQVKEVSLFFGYSWGSSIYPGDWHEITAATKTVEKTILDAEKATYGKLADDNLYLAVPSYRLRLHYSYESDIHLSYKDSNILVETILNRWSSDKWLLVHWSKQKQAERRQCIVLK